MIKKLYLLATAVIVMAACKKQLPEITQMTSPDQEPPIAEAPVPCYGNVWTPATDYVGIPHSPCLVYNNKAYFFNARVEPNSDPLHNTVTIFDGANWETKPSAIPSPFSTYGYAHFWFSIGSKAYFGKSWPPTKYFYQYDFVTNVWTQKADFPGPHRGGATAFAVGTKGYMMGGRDDNTHFRDTWEYNPATNTWAKKADFPGFGKWGATGFSIGNKGYLVNGRIRTVNSQDLSVSDYYLNNLAEYNPATNTWTTKTAFPGEPRGQSKVFVIQNYGYVGGGIYSETELTVYTQAVDFYRYNPDTNTWSSIADFPHTNPSMLLNDAFAINSKGYVVWNGEDDPKIEKYSPKICSPITPGGRINTGKD